MESESKSKFHIYAEVPKDILTEKAVIADDSKFKIRLRPEDEHPFDFKLMEDLYRDFGFVGAFIDKYVDFIVGPGFYVKVDKEKKEAEKKQLKAPGEEPTEDEEPEEETDEAFPSFGKPAPEPPKASPPKQVEDKRPQLIMEQFLQDVNFDSVLREWVREALIKGNGFLEIMKGKSGAPETLAVVNANNMYVVREKTTGKIQYYKQIVNRMTDDKKENPEFKPDEIAHLPFNRMPQRAYGYGMVYPSHKMVNQFLGNIKDIHQVVSRKAGAPIIARIGNKDAEASPADIDGFGQKLQYLNNKTEWAVDWKVDIQSLNMGDLGKNFESVLTFDRDMLITSFQIPEVMMGKGNVPEGLAQVQSDVFERRIQSLQAEIEKVIETQIFKPFMKANGFDVHVEFEWGAPSDADLKEKIQMYQGLMGNMSLSPKFKQLIELRIAKLLDLDMEEITEDMTKNLELEEPQPKVPFKKKEHIHKESFVEVDDTDYSIKEWLGFNFVEYLDYIKAFITKDKFENLVANTQEELEAGYLTSQQVEELKQTLTDNLEEGGSIKKISNDIKDKVSPGAVYQMTDSGNVVKEDGQKVLVLSEEERSIAIARSEVTRVSANGVQDYYKEKGIKTYEWVASLGDRTCPICEGLNGKTFPIDGGPLPGDPHPNCRCTIIAVTG